MLRLLAFAAGVLLAATGTFAATVSTPTRVPYRLDAQGYQKSPDTGWEPTASPHPSDWGELPWLQHVPKQFDPPAYHMSKSDDIRVAYRHGGAAPAAAVFSCSNFSASHQNFCGQNALQINTGRAPCWQDSNLVEDSAYSNQLGTYHGAGYATALANRVAFFRQFNSYWPGVDGPIGSQCPYDSGSGGSSLRAIGSFVNCNAPPCTPGTTDDDSGTCKFYVSGAGGSPANPFATSGGFTAPDFIYCLVLGPNTTVTLRNFDFTNECGVTNWPATGGNAPCGNKTSFVPIWVASNGSFQANDTLNIYNSYITCPNSGTGPGGWCGGLPNLITCNPSCAGGANGGAHWVNTKSAGGGQFTTYNFFNDWFDGNNYNIIATHRVPGVSSAAGLARFFSSGYGTTANNGTVVLNVNFTNTVMENAGHTASITTQSTHMETHASMFNQVCISGFNGCHGEIGEMAQGLNGMTRQSLVQLIEDGTTWVSGAWGYTSGGASDAISGETTAPVYMTSGGANYVIIPTGQVSDFFALNDNQVCTNDPVNGQTGTYSTMVGANWPYSPANNCALQPSQVGAAGIISTGWPPYIQNLTLQYILADVSGMQGCSVTGNSKPLNAVAPGFNAWINITGTTLTVVAPQTFNPLGLGGDSAHGPSWRGASALYPGEWVVDYAGNFPSFVQAYTIGTVGQGQLGNLNNFATMQTSNSQSAGQVNMQNTETLEIGQPIWLQQSSGLVNQGFVQQSGCTASSGCGALNTEVTGTTFVLTSASCGSAGCPISSVTPPTSTGLSSYDDGPNCVGGHTVMCGTLTMSAAQPGGCCTLGGKQNEWAIITHVDTLMETSNFVYNNGAGAPGTQIHFADYVTPVYTSSGSYCN